jgi:hypothetical protein
LRVGVGLGIGVGVGVGVGLGVAVNVPVIEAVLLDESGSLVELVTTVVVVKSPWALMFLAVTEKLADSS